MAGRRIMFVSSNGTGLGHLTRSMAIARRLEPDAESLFVTFSRAAPVVRGIGFPVEFMASHGSTGAGSDLVWSRRTAARLRAAIGEVRPDLLLFDGILPYDPLIAAMRRVPITVWSRRGMWRPGASTAPLTRADLFDAILEPGELAATADTGPTAARREEAHRVDPMVFLDDSELLSRQDAARELGLDPERPAILVQLGQGADVAAATDRALRELTGHDGVQVAAASSAIAALLDVPDGVVHLRSAYPMSRYYAAFDGAVSAAGYNAFHELVRFGVPALFVPMHRDTDDQGARAAYAAQAGVGLAVDGPHDGRIADRLGELLDPKRRQAMRERLAEIRPQNGAAEAARWLQSLLESPQEGFAAGDVDAQTRHRSSLHARAARARVFVRTLPQTLARLTRQTLTAPRPRTLILAFGADEAQILDAIRRAEDSPERILVVTDSLAIGDVWRAGTAVEHIPGPGERQADLSGLEYQDFRRRRLDLILARRPRMRDVIEVGEGH
jgi:UDP:flavonoid glycosyltransferase YjiC (YdhE family)